MVEQSLELPNGIGLSPDEKTLYISDTGSAASTIVQRFGSQAATFDNWNITGARSIYAFDVVEGTYLSGKRVIYKAQSLAPDGMKVAKNGYVLAATGSGVDVLDSRGTYIMRIQTNFTVNQFAWAGADYRQIWMTGVGGIARATLNLPGQGN